MFDLGRLGETLSGFIGQAQDAAPPSNLLELIQSAGLDPSVLEGLDAPAIVALLAEHGIDLGQFSPEQVQNVLGSFGVDPSSFGDLGSLVGSWFANR